MHLFQKLDFTHGIENTMLYRQNCPQILIAELYSFAYTFVKTQPCGLKFYKLNVHCRLLSIICSSSFVWKKFRHLHYFRGEILSFCLKRMSNLPFEKLHCPLFGTVTWIWYSRKFAILWKRQMYIRSLKQDR